MRHHLALAVLLFAVSACESTSPFVYHEHAMAVGKDADLVRKFGAFTICHGDADADKAATLAVETCAEYGLKARLASEMRYQCSIAEPHLSQYVCINPDMRMKNGNYINPLNKKQVQDWKEEQSQSKRKTLKPKAESSAPMPNLQNDDGFVLSPGDWGQAWEQTEPQH